jgi:mRNA interferase HigB
VRVISKKRLREFWEKHADAKGALETWHSVAKSAKWQKLLDVQQTYSGAEAVNQFTVFNIKGNSYRLIVKIEYKLQIIYINCVLTHAEYDKGGWK